MEATVAAENLEAQEAWNGVLFDRFVKFRHLVIVGLAPHGDRAIRAHPPQAGDRVLDIGCGFGDTTQELAKIVGSKGSALGVDVAPRFIEAAIDEAAEAGADNVSFEVCDLEAGAPDGPFDYAFARFGTMFFANPVPAMRNIRQALAPGGRLCIVVWRRKLDNPWLHRAEEVVKPLIEVPEETDEPRCGPGPFSMADADTTSQILLSAGFEEVGFERCDIRYKIGIDLDEAVEFNMAIGPAAEVIRLAGDTAADVRPEVERLLRETLAEFETEDGIVADSSTWTVTASAPLDVAA